MKNNDFDLDNINLNELFPLFNGIPLSVQEEIKYNSVLKFYPNKALIFPNNASLKHIYLIIKGTIHIIKHDKDGKEQIVSILRRGDFFPHVGLFENKSPGSAHATEDTTILLLTVDYLREIAFKYPVILMEYSKELSRKIVELQSRLEEKAFLSTYQQVIRRILFLADKYGEAIEADKIKLKLSLTHEELAHLVGTTRETVSRSVTKLKKLNALQINNGEWIVYINRLEKEKQDQDANYNNKLT